MQIGLRFPRNNLKNKEILHYVSVGNLASVWQANPAMKSLPTLQPQEIPLDHPDSNNMFLPTAEKPLVATQPAIAMYSQSVIFACLTVLSQKADEHGGLDYLQVFESNQHAENLWFIENNEAITSLLPSDY